MIESLIKNLNQDIALLQLRINQDKKAGFTNMARLLESMSMRLFKALDIADLKSKNQIQVNFPAIDSADEHRDGGIALQVTSVADTRKIKKTIEMFEKKDSAGRSLKDGYATLYIFGFCQAVLAARVPSYCKIIDPSFFINTLIDLDDEEKAQLVLDSIRRHVDYSSLHPYEDIECLKIMLGYVGRPAIRHYMCCEGNINDMTKGLKEVAELIGKGSVSGRQKSKAQHEFSDPKIGSFLRHVQNEIGGITATIHKASRSDGFVCLNHREMEAIDKRKRSISEAARHIADSYGIDMQLSMHDDY